MSNTSAPTADTEASVPTAKDQAYQQYRNAATEGSKVNVGHASVLSDDFVSYVETFRTQDPAAVDVEHLGGEQSFAAEMLYRAALTTSFHTHHAQYDPRHTGLGNYPIVELRRNASNGHHTFHLHGLTVDSDALRLENAALNLTSTSLTFEEGVVQATLRLTDHEVSGVTVWNLTVTVLGRTYYRLYLVPFAL